MNHKWRWLRAHEIGSTLIKCRKILKKFRGGRVTEIIHSQLQSCKQFWGSTSQIPLFTSMRIWIRLSRWHGSLSGSESCSWYNWRKSVTTGLQTFHGSNVRVYGPPWLYFEPQQFLNCDFDADPAFPCDPNLLRFASGSATLVVRKVGIPLWQGQLKRIILYAKEAFSAVCLD